MLDPTVKQRRFAVSTEKVNYNQGQKQLLCSLCNTFDFTFTEFKGVRKGVIILHLGGCVKGEVKAEYPCCLELVLSLIQDFDVLGLELTPAAHCILHDKSNEHAIC